MTESARLAEIEQVLREELAAHARPEWRALAKDRGWCLSGPDVAGLQQEADGQRTARDAAEARLSAATRVVEAAVLAAVPLEALRLSVRDELSAEVKLAIITATDALRAALREWKEGSK